MGPRAPSQYGVIIGFYFQMFCLSKQNALSISTRHTHHLQKPHAESSQLWLMLIWFSFSLWSSSSPSLERFFLASFKSFIWSNMFLCVFVREGHIEGDERQEINFYMSHWHQKLHLTIPSGSCKGLLLLWLFCPKVMNRMLELLEMVAILI